MKKIIKIVKIIVGIFLFEKVGNTIASVYDIGMLITSRKPLIVNGMYKHKNNIILYSPELKNYILFDKESFMKNIDDISDC